MLSNALLIIAITQGTSTTVNYEKIESIHKCEIMAEEVKNDSDEGVYVLCIPIETISEV